MVGVNGHRNGYAEFIAHGVNLQRQVPETHRTIRVRSTLGFGYLDDDGGIRLLGRQQCASGPERVPGACGYRHGLALGNHGTVYHFAANYQRLRVWKQFYDVRWTANR